MYLKNNENTKFKAEEYKNDTTQKNTSGGGRSNIAIFLMDKSFKANSIKKEHFILINTTIFQDVRIIKYYVTTIALKFTQ